MTDTHLAAAVPTFWSWFHDNSDALFTFERDQDRVFARLSAAMSAVHPDLTFEFGPVVEGKREFVISAGGIKDAFSAVFALAAGAPALEHWSVIAFRPRREPGEVRLGPTVVRSSDVVVIPERLNGKVGVQILIHGYRSTPNSIFEQVGFLLLDQVLGEFDVETKLGYIEIGSRPSALPKTAISLAELPEFVDRATAT